MSNANFGRDQEAAAMQAEALQLVIEDIRIRLCALEEGAWRRERDAVAIRMEILEASFNRQTKARSSECMHD